MFLILTNASVANSCFDWSCFSWTLLSTSCCSVWPFTLQLFTENNTILSGSLVVAARHFELEVFVKLPCVSSIFTQTTACSIWAEVVSVATDKTSLFFSFWECPTRLLSLSGRTGEVFHWGSMDTAFCSYIIKLVPGYDYSLWNFWNPSGKKCVCQMDDTRIVLCDMPENRLIVFMTYGQPLTQQLTVAWKNHQPSPMTFLKHKSASYNLWSSGAALPHI